MAWDPSIRATCFMRTSILWGIWKSSSGTLKKDIAQMPSGPRALTINEIIDERPLSRFQIRTIVLCGVVLVLEGFDAQCIGFLAPSISETLRIPLRTFGPIFAAGLIGLMVAAMAIGPVADRWGRKWPLVAATLTFAVFSLLTARVTSFNELLILRFLTG